MLLKGVEKHGVAWAKITKDEEFNLSHRTSTDLRDRFRNAFPAKYDMYGYSPRQKRKNSAQANSVTDSWSKITQQPAPPLTDQVHQQAKNQREDQFTEDDVSVIYRASYDPDRGLATAHAPSEHSAGFRHLIQRPETAWMSDRANDAALTYSTLTDAGYASTIAPGETSSIDALSEHVVQITQQQPEASIDLIRSMSDIRKR